SITFESMVTCCIFPRGSVKRRSTNLISSSLIFFVTVLPSAIVLPCHSFHVECRPYELAATIDPARATPVLLGHLVRWHHSPFRPCGCALLPPHSTRRSFRRLCGRSWPRR